MDFRWDDIRLFLALYRERTLAAAGARLKLDGSTMSRRLTAFEETLGRVLFERTRDGLVPTPAAEELVELAESMELAGRRFAERAEALDAGVEGLVRITTPPLVAEAFVAPVLPALLEAYPALRIEIDASQRRLDLSRGEADIAIRDAAQAVGDVVVTRLMTLDFGLLASPALARRLGVVDDLERLSWISWGDPVLHLPASDWLRTHVPNVEPVLRSSSLAAQLAAAAHGLGVVLAPRVFTRSHEVVPLELGPKARERAASWPREDLWIAAARSRRSLARVDAVWAFLLESAAEVSRLVPSSEGPSSPPRPRRSVRRPE